MTFFCEGCDVRWVDFARFFADFYYPSLIYGWHIGLLLLLFCIKESNDYSFKKNCNKFYLLLWFFFQCHRFLLVLRLRREAEDEEFVARVCCGIRISGCPNGLVPEVDPPLPRPGQFQLILIFDVSRYYYIIAYS